MREKMKKHVVGTFEDGEKSGKFATSVMKEKMGMTEPDFKTARKRNKVKE